MLNYLWAALLSITPIGELRIGIPFALVTGANPWLALIVCIAGNALVIPIVYFFLEHIHHRFMHHGRYRSLFDKFMEKTRQKIHPLVEKYGIAGLVIFTAVPIPGTGAYAASAIAWFLGIPFKKALPAITIGILVSGLIVLGVIKGGMTFLSII